MATACCIVEKLLLVEVTLVTSFESMRYLNIGLSPLSPSVFSFNCLLLNFNLFDLSVTTAICVATQTYPSCAVEFSFEESRGPECRLSCFLCLALQGRGKEFVVELAENSTVQSPLLKKFQAFSIAGRRRSCKSCSDNNSESKYVTISGSSML